MLFSVQGERLLELRKLRYLLSDGYVTALVQSLSHAVAFISPRIRGLQSLYELMRVKKRKSKDYPNKVTSACVN